MINFRTESPVPRNRPLLPRRYGRRSCFAHSSKKSPCFSNISPKMVLDSVTNLHPVVFLQSIGLELIISSQTASYFDSTLSLHSFSLTSTVLPIRMGFLRWRHSRNAYSDGIPPMKAFPQCQFGWDYSDEGFPAMPIRMGFLQWRLTGNANSDGIPQMAFLTESSVKIWTSMFHESIEFPSSQELGIGFYWVVE